VPLKYLSKGARSFRREVKNSVALLLWKGSVGVVYARIVEATRKDVFQGGGS
jgi:hypothetical protein